MINWSTNASLLAFGGGLAVGSVAIVRMLTVGKVTGISGILSGLTEFSSNSSYDRLWKLVYFSGMIAGGGVATVLFPASFESWSGLPVYRLVLGGVLVGYGTTLGNGCTSGHGVCGISSFRTRSIASTAIFMASGIVSAIATNTISYLPAFQNTLPEGLSFGALSISIGALTGLALTSRYLFSLDEQSENSVLLKVLIGSTEFLCGLTFALGMSVSNMTKLSATISFLDLRNWNPALAFVMAGAIGITAPSFYLIRKYRGSPLLFGSFSAPSLTEIDRPLVLGAVIFGMGWGLVGACPGPAIVNLAGRGAPQATYFASLVLGMWLKQMYNPFVTTANVAPSMSKSLVDKESEMNAESSLRSNPKPQYS